MNRLQRLNELKTLKKGWLNGDGKVITKAALSKAAELIVPRIYPTVDGGITLETDEYDIIVRPDGTVDIICGRTVVGVYEKCIF
jgi:hypothetical protein